jgi:hypothetical protein
MSSTFVHEIVDQEVAEQRIRSIAESCYHHPALNNAFYLLWCERELPVDDVELVAKNFYEHVAPTANRLALVFLSMPPGEVQARAETIENLSDELGHGDPCKVHSVILRNLIEELLSRMHGKEVTFEALTAEVLPTTSKLVEQGAALFASTQPEIGCGALLAQEWHAYLQLIYLYEGFRNYMGYFSLEEFHENCEYFYLHIGATEKEHKIHSISTAARMCRTTEQLDYLEQGYTAYLDLLAEYWAGLHRALSVN